MFGWNWKVCSLMYMIFMKELSLLCNTNPQSSPLVVSAVCGKKGKSIDAQKSAVVVVN